MKVQDPNKLIRMRQSIRDDASNPLKQEVESAKSQSTEIEGVGAIIVSGIIQETKR